MIPGFFPNSGTLGCWSEVGIEPDTDIIRKLLGSSKWFEFSKDQIELKVAPTLGNPRSQYNWDRVVKARSQ